MKKVKGNGKKKIFILFFFLLRIGENDEPISKKWD
jgi:hypothetical protein